MKEKANLLDSASADLKYIEAKAWLNDYQTGGIPFLWNFWTKFIRSPQEASNLVVAADQRREKSFFKPVQEANTSTEIIKVGKEYLKEYPQGINRSEVEIRVNKAEWKIAQEENKAYLFELENNFDELVARNAEIHEFELFEDKLNEPFPREEFFDEEGIRAKSELQGKVAEKLTDLGRALRIKELRKSITTICKKRICLRHPRA